ncbi:MAG TPA: hypothetical protein VFR49_02145 [Solirubrobacteraceae bacterium]|nr:hypothetical protein [Solirubrobacteraceae bacterium]
MSLRRPIVLFLVLLALVLVGLAGLLAARDTGTAVDARVASPAALAQARADALAGVAARLYYEETYGSPNSAAVRLVSRLPGLIAGLETGDVRRAVRALNSIVVDHIVRDRITRGRRTLIDDGLPFVISGQRHPLRAPDGTYLGRIEVSIQDVIGLIKLFHRFTGAEIVVRGTAGHAKSSLPALDLLPLPSTGPFSLAGRTYYVSSFSRVGFAGEPLRLWILGPAR